MFIVPKIDFIICPKVQRNIERRKRCSADYMPRGLGISATELSTFRERSMQWIWAMRYVLAGNGNYVIYLVHAISVIASQVEEMEIHVILKCMTGWGSL